MAPFVTFHVCPNHALSVIVSMGSAPSATRDIGAKNVRSPVRRSVAAVPLPLEGVNSRVLLVMLVSLLFLHDILSFLAIFTSTLNFDSDTALCR